MTKIISMGYGDGRDTIEDLKNVLGKYTLDPRFERYGNFVNRNPVWDNKELDDKYRGCTTLFGNFLEYSYVFNIITDDEGLISEIEELVQKNKKMVGYVSERNRLIG